MSSLDSESLVKPGEIPDCVSISVALCASSNAAESAASAGLPAGNEDWSQVNLLNASGDEAYPIVSFSYLIVYKELNVIPSMTESKATELIQFLSYVIHDGQQFAEGLEYAPIPSNVVQLDETTIQSITFNGQTIPTS